MMDIIFSQWNSSRGGEKSQNFSIADVDSEEIKRDIFKDQINSLYFDVLYNNIKNLVEYTFEYLTHLTTFQVNI